jgi:hypothetical protein
MVRTGQLSVDHIMYGCQGNSDAGAEEARPSSVYVPVVSVLTRTASVGFYVRNLESSEKFSVCVENGNIMMRRVMLTVYYRASL